MLRRGWVVVVALGGAACFSDVGGGTGPTADVTSATTDETESGDEGGTTAPDPIGPIDGSTSAGSAVAGSTSAGEESSTANGSEESGGSGTGPTCAGEIPDLEGCPLTSALPSVAPYQCSDLLTGADGESTTCQRSATDLSRIFTWTPPRPGSYVISTAYTIALDDHDTVLEVRRAGAVIACDDDVDSFASWGTTSAVRIDVDELDELEINVHLRTAEGVSPVDLLVGEVCATAPSCCTPLAESCGQDDPVLHACVTEFDGVCNVAYDESCANAAFAACLADCA